MATLLAEEFTGNPEATEAPIRELESAGESLPVYLQEIGRVPLLTAAAEVEVATAMESGLAAERLLQQNLSPSEIDRLLKAGPSERERLLDRLVPGFEERDAAEDDLELVQAGREARQHLIVANLRLVVSIARRYMNRGIPLGDLIQEGNIGLLRAVEKFDYHRGFKFSTYATWWIRQAITRALADHARTIRIPVHMVESINRMIRTMNRLQQELGREPTMDELGVALELPVEKVREMIGMLPQPISIDTPLGDDQDA